MMGSTLFGGTQCADEEDVETEVGEVRGTKRSRKGRGNEKQQFNLGFSSMKGGRKRKN